MEMFPDVVIVSSTISLALLTWLKSDEDPIDPGSLHAHITYRCFLC